jgi:hypothetical protein
LGRLQCGEQFHDVQRDREIILLVDFISFPNASPLVAYPPHQTPPVSCRSSYRMLSIYGYSVIPKFCSVMEWGTEDSTSVVAAIDHVEDLSAFHLGRPFLEGLCTLNLSFTILLIVRITIFCCRGCYLSELARLTAESCRDCACLGMRWLVPCCRCGLCPTHPAP